MCCGMCTELLCLSLVSPEMLRGHSLWVLGAHLGFTCSNHEHVCIYIQGSASL